MGEGGGEERGGSVPKLWETGERRTAPWGYRSRHRDDQSLQDAANARQTCVLYMAALPLAVCW